MPVYKDDTNLHAIYKDGTEIFRVYKDSSLIYSKILIRFWDNWGNSIVVSSPHAWYNDGIEWWPSNPNRDYYDFIGWSTSSSGGSSFTGFNSIPSSWWEQDWGSGVIPIFDVYAQWKQQTYTIYFGANALCWDYVSQNYPSKITFPAGSTYRQALSDIANSYTESYTPYYCRFYYPDWNEYNTWESKGDGMVHFQRIGWSSNSSGDMNYNKTYSNEIAPNGGWLYPSFSDWYVNVSSSGWTDLSYGITSRSNGMGQVYIQGENVTGNCSAWW